MKDKNCQSFESSPFHLRFKSFLWQLGVKIIFSQETCCTLREPTYNNTSLVDFNCRWKHLVITLLSNLSTLSNTRKGVGVGRGYFYYNSIWCQDSKFFAVFFLLDVRIASETEVKTLETEMRLINNENTRNVSLHPSVHQSLFQGELPQTFLVDAQPRKVSENIPCSEILKRINVEDQSFMHCCPRHGLWNELWCLGKHAGGCFYNNSNSGKNKVTPW